VSTKWIVLVCSIKYGVTKDTSLRSAHQIYKWTIFSGTATRSRMKMYVSEKYTYTKS